MEEENKLFPITGDPYPYHNAEAPSTQPESFTDPNQVWIHNLRIGTSILCKENLQNCRMAVQISPWSKHLLVTWMECGLDFLLNSNSQQFVKGP